MQTILFIIGFFTLGFLARKVISEPTNVVKWVNNFIVYIAMPSIIFIKIPHLEFTPAMFIPVGFSWAWALIGGAMILTISRCLSFPRPLEGAALLLGILGNTSFLGFPMIQALFNDDVLAYAIFYDQLGNFLVFSTAGLILIAAYAPSGSGHTVSVAGIAKRVFGFPPFIALLLATALPIEPLTQALEPLLLTLGKTLMPLALFVLGVQFQPKLLPEHKLPLITSLSVKMIVAPIIAIGFFSAYPANTAVQQATIFEAAMPCMITPGIMAIQAGLSPRFCATLLGYSTLFSFVWLPFLAMFI